MALCPLGVAFHHLIRPRVLPLLVPLALLPWRSAIVLWIALNVIAFVSIVSTLALVQTPYCSRRAPALVLCALVLAPFHTAIAVGNIVLVVFALGCWRVSASNAALMLRQDFCWRRPLR